MMMMMMMKNNNKKRKVINNNNHEKEVAEEEVVDHDDKEDEDDVPLPGFRFHPTDQELLGFYLQRKVENRGMSIELIKHVDIYKYDPWDLPSCSGSSYNVGDKEWYFYCKRGRKYKNSARPNRVTASGFWKATGIDRPIYNNNTITGSGIIIGLKKSLVFYTGSAGKGTKTDWMMHEFRLPPVPPAPQYHMIMNNNINNNIINHHHQEAEVWTLCRIIKRNNNNATYNNNKYCSIMMQPKPCSNSNLQSAAVPLISFTDPLAKHEHSKKKKKQKHDHHDLLIMKTLPPHPPPTVLDNIMESSSGSTTTTASNHQNLNIIDYYNYINSSSSSTNITKYYGGGNNWDALSSLYLESCFASGDAPVDDHLHHPNFLPNL